MVLAAYRGDGQGDGECCAGAGSSTGYRDGSAVGFDERFGDGEPDTGAAVLAVAGGVCPVEPFEHSGDVLGGDPFSGVGDSDFYLVAVTKTVKVYRPAGRCVP